MWNRRKDDLTEELQAHLRMAIDDRLSRGECDEQARVGALKELGNLPLIADVTRHQWGWSFFEQFGQDLRTAVRKLLSSPVYTITVILTLSLVIGANSAFFDLLYGLLLRSLPVPHPARLVQVKLQLSSANTPPMPASDVLPGAIYETLLPQQKVFTGMCSWQERDITLRDLDGTHHLESASMNASCLNALEVHAALGRLFHAEDDGPGGHPNGFPIVLAYNYWRTHFGEDPNVLGRVLNFAAGNHAKASQGIIVGVMQPAFTGLQVGARPAIFVLSEMTAQGDRGNFHRLDHFLFARLRDGVSISQAQAQIDILLNDRLRQEKPFPFFIFDKEGFRPASAAHLQVNPGRTGYTFLRKQYAEPLYIVEGVMSLALLVACAYLAMLAWTRGLTQRREISVRVALGASRWRIAAQLCYESAILALAGSVAGVILAWAAIKALLGLMKENPWNDAPFVSTGPDIRTLMFTAGLTVFTVLIAGLWPAWYASRVDPATGIKDRTSANPYLRNGGLGPWLLPLQLGLSFIVVMVAALMGCTVVRLMRVDPGFSSSGVVFLSADFSGHVSPVRESTSVLPHLTIAILGRIRGTAGVESASISQFHQMGGGMMTASASSLLPSGEIKTDANVTSLLVTPQYFETLGIAMLQGRDFTPQDNEEMMPVCILSKSSAEYLFPKGNAVGQTLRVGEKSAVRVIAVVRNTLYNDLREEAPRIIYQPYLAGTALSPFVEIAVRSQNTAKAVAVVRDAVNQFTPDVAVDRPATIKELIRGTMIRERMVASLAAFFALLTLVLTAVGLYGVLNNMVACRRTEIGVRMAIGASPSSIIGMVMAQAARLILPGALLGAFGVWCATRLLRSLLFEVEPLDPWLFAATALVLVVVAVVACLQPASRAAIGQPMDALRFE